MKKLFEAANRYIETSDWKNLRWLAWIVLALVAVTVVLLVIS